MARRLPDLNEIASRSTTPDGPRGLGSNKVRQGQQTQKDMLKFIRDYITEHGLPPSNTEIAAGMSINPETVRRRLRDLVDRGAITKGPGSRAIVVKEDE